MNFDEAVGFYHSLNRFGVQPGLDRIKALCKELNDPQKKLRCVHVAGTNGKGSTCTFIAGVLREAGYNVGLYTSPYVIEFRERISFNGEFIPKSELCRVTKEVAAALKKVNEKGVFPTEFEAVTAAAFKFYADSGCDIVVLETGLGGRYDATNIIESPIFSVITSVSLDHTAILGDTVEKIAWEKAGIIKAGRPVVTTVHQNAGVIEVIKSCADEKSAELILANDGKMLSVIDETLFSSDVVYNGKRIHIPFGGAHQRENLSLCLKAVDILRQNGFTISDNSVADGIKKAFIPARTEVLCDKPLIILDGSHNISSTAALAALLKSRTDREKTVAVMGMMADKDCSSSLDNLLPCFSEITATTPSNPRAMKAAEFAELAEKKGFACNAVDDPCKAVDYVLNKAFNCGCNAVICGSLYLAADVREHLIKEIGRRNRERNRSSDI